MRKFVVVGIIILLVGVNVSGGLVKETKDVSTTCFDGNTLYVGGSGPNNYSKIQYAIDNASDGDTVFVYSGIYYENLIINKSIILEGENKNSTIIEGSKSYFNGIIIKRNNVSVFNFKIQNHQLGGIEIEYSDFCKIYNNIIDNNRYGVYSYYSSNNSIYDNIVVNHPIDGISIHKSQNNFVYRNIISNTGNKTYQGNGVTLWNANYNIIVENCIENSSGNGIFCISCDNVSIYENNINHNRENGVEFVFSSYLQICSNIIKQNNGNGIYYLSGINSSILNISNNQISGNNNSGIIIIRDYNFIDLIGNDIEHNNHSGIQLEGCNFCNIFYNNISYNKDGGIIFRASYNSTISNNFIIHNKNVGLYLFNSLYNQIINNSFISRYKKANFLISYYNLWDGNYWNRPRLLPKIIFGRVGAYRNIPWINIDWHPASEPYDIEV